MGDVDLGLAMLNIGGNRDSKVLVGRRARLVVDGREVAVVKDGTHGVRGSRARRRRTRQDTNRNLQFSRSGQGILIVRLATSTDE